MSSYNVTNALTDHSPETMFREIESAEKQRESALMNYDALLRNAMATEEWPESLTHQYLSNMVPRIVQENPTCAVSSRSETSELVADQELEKLDVALAMGLIDPATATQMADELVQAGLDALAGQAFLKRWIEQADYRALLDRLVDDYLKTHAVELTYMGADENDPERRWPCSCRIDPRRYVHDAAAIMAGEWAWQAHWYPIPKKLLMMKAQADEDEQGGWNLEAIEALTPMGDDRLNIDRQDVKVWESWIPGYKGDEFDIDDPSFNGGFITLGTTKDGPSNSRGIEIRKPRPAYVPPWGPYTLYGCYNRSTSAWPMSPLLATFKQQEELQKHARAMNINARQYKRVVIVSDSNPALVQQLTDAPDHLVIPVNDDQFDSKKVVSIEMGGISDQQLVMYNQLKSALFRAMGMDDQQLGKVDSNATATAVAVADESVATRVSYIEGKFIAGVRNSLRTKLWYACMDERVSFKLGREFGEQLGMADPWFQGGGDFNINDLELVIDPYSMGRVSEQALQQRVSGFIETLITLAPMMLQFPFIDWKAVIRSLTQVLNLPGMDQFIDWNMMQQTAQIQAAMGGMQQGTEMSGDSAVKQSKGGGSSGGAKPPMSNAQQLIQQRAGGNIGNLNYKGAAA